MHCKVKPPPRLDGLAGEKKVLDLRPKTFFSHFDIVAGKSFLACLL